jgi:branched-chain amino acid transport system permease protein
MEFLNILIQGILLGGLYALYGTGLSLIFGVMRLVNLAHGDFIIAAAYAALVIGQVLGLNAFLAVLLVAPVFFALGVLLQRTVLNRVLGTGTLPPLLITFGMSMVLQNALLLGFTATNKRLSAGGIEASSLQLAPNVFIGYVPILTFVTSIVVIASLQLLFTRTRYGRAFRATSDDVDTAKLMGINSQFIYGVAFGLCLAIVAIAGILLGVRTNFAPADGPGRLVYAFESVIIGGLGNLWGTLVGGIILGVAQTVGAQLNPVWFQLSGHLITLLVLVVRPTGLFSRTRDA